MRTRNLILPHDVAVANLEGDHDAAFERLHDLIWRDGDHRPAPRLTRRARRNAPDQRAHRSGGSKSSACARCGLCADRPPARTSWAKAKSVVASLFLTGPARCAGRLQHGDGLVARNRRRSAGALRTAAGGRRRTAATSGCRDDDSELSWAAPSGVEETPPAAHVEMRGRLSRETTRRACVINTRASPIQPASGRPRGWSRFGRSECVSREDEPAMNDSTQDSRAADSQFLVVPPACRR